MKRKEDYDMKCRRHIQSMQAIVVLLLCRALSLSVVSMGVTGEQKEALFLSLQPYELRGEQGG
jgi:hypothetical protein